MGIDIRPVRSREEFDRFSRLPWSLYAGDPQWVPPLLGDFRKIFDRRRNPFFAHGEIEPLVAYRGSEPVGRIAAIRNRNHEKFWNERCGFFGFFESVDDPVVAKALIDAARERCRSWDLDRMRGPVNPTTNDECGVLVEGFDTPPAVMMSHSRPYYDALLSVGGLTKAKDLLAYWLEAPEHGTPERLERGAKLVRARHPEIRFRALDKKDFDAELIRFKQVYNAAWEKNWGFVPMTDAEIDHMASQLKQVLDPGLIRIAEHGDRPVAFALGLPDLNQAIRHADGRLFPFGLLKILWHSRRIHTARVLVLGVLEEYRGRGLDVVLYQQLFEYGVPRGYRAAELSWILEDNVAIRRPLEAMGGRVYKVYRLYETSTGS